MNWPEPRPIAEAPVDDNVLAWWPPYWSDDGEWAVSWRRPDGVWARIGSDPVAPFRGPTQWMPLPPPLAQEGDSA